jgi:hypothetical protein
MTALLLQIVNSCVLGLGFYQFLRECKDLVKKISIRVKGFFTDKRTNKNLSFQKLA